MDKDKKETAQVFCILAIEFVVVLILIQLVNVFGG